jgi:hypothetical protein
VETDDVGRLDEIYIIRVRSDEGDAVVEDVRWSRRAHVADLSELGPLIIGWRRRAAARERSVDAPVNATENEDRP